MPTRKIKSSPVKVTGAAPDGQQFESFLEEDFFVLLRFNRNVESWDSQTVTIHWRDVEGKMRRYTPDVLVRYKGTAEDPRPITVLCEIKPDLDSPADLPRARLPRREDPDENERKWEAAKKFAAKEGWTFKVFRESDIRTNYLRNAKFLMRYLERKNSFNGESALLAALSKHRRMTLREWALPFSNSVAQRAEHLPTCYRLIAEGQVKIDLSQLLSLDTVVELVDD